MSYMLIICNAVYNTKSDEKLLLVSCVIFIQDIDKHRILIFILKYD